MLYGTVINFILTTVCALELVRDALVGVMVGMNGGMLEN